MLTNSIDQKEFNAKSLTLSPVNIQASWKDKRQHGGHTCALWRYIRVYFYLLPPNKCPFAEDTSKMDLKEKLREFR